MIDRPTPRRRTCATMEVHYRLLETDPEYLTRITQLENFTRRYLQLNAGAGLRSGVAVIPVVVHVVFNTAAQNITDAQIQSQIAVLNQDYRMLNPDVAGVPAAYQPLTADARIQFQLAVRDPSCNPTNGITRTATTTASFSTNDAVKSAATGGADPWPSGQYFNIWVCRLGGGVLGYATFPGAAANIDGAVITDTAFGNTGTVSAPFGLGRTASHEIGHWFNLHHIWGDAFCGDDLVADTPTQQGPNFGCPTFPHVTCGNGPNGDLFNDFMDYTDDACMFMFSAGQAARMEAALNGARAAILGSQALVPPPAVAGAVLWSADTPTDTGAEPDPAPVPMWESDDIWVRNTNDGLTNQTHQNPIYRPAGTGANYVYVRVRNKACAPATSGSGTLKLYWGKASSALGWPAPWDGSVVAPVVMGGSVGSLPTGNVPGGGFNILEFPWYPPNPADYAAFGADKSHFCVLARTETSAVAPYGMTFPEGPDLYANVTNNARIVWKNITVADPGPRLAYLTVGNMTKEPMIARFAFVTRTGAIPEKSVFELGTVLVNLGPHLLETWKAGGSKGEGVEAVGEGRVKITGEKASLANLRFQPNELHTIAFELQRERKHAGTRNFVLDFTQLVGEGKGERILGGQRILLKTVLRRRRRGEVGELPRTVFSHWVHSHEEDTEEVMVFRRSDYSFPRSRGRRGFEIREDGGFIRHDIAPTDGLRTVAAQWEAAPDATRLHVEDEEGRSEILEIISVDEEILRIKRPTEGAASRRAESLAAR